MIRKLKQVQKEIQKLTDSKEEHLERVQSNSNRNRNKNNENIYLKRRKNIRLTKNKCFHINFKKTYDMSLLSNLNE